MQTDSKLDKKITDYFRKHPSAPFTTFQKFREDAEKLSYELNAPLEKVAKVEDISLLSVNLRIYHPFEVAKGGTVLFFHGGGFVRGSILSHDPMCRRMANLSGWPIVSVDYRLSPEHTFPAALKDAELAYQWLREKGPRHGLDGVQIVVAGDSAGGTLAARIVQNHRFEVAAEILMYPWLDLSLSFPSYHKYGRGYLLDRSRLVWTVEQYISKEHDLKDPDVSPFWEKNLFEMPPTLMLSAELDPLIDENKSYADLLLERGNEVQYEVFPHMPHGFAFYGKLVKKTLDDFYAKISEFLKTFS